MNSAGNTIRQTSSQTYRTTMNGIIGSGVMQSWNIQEPLLGPVVFVGPPLHHSRVCGSVWL